MIMIGRTLSHYKILEEISRGGMGIVYKALDLKLNREVALKVLPPKLVSDPDRKRRFVQEAQAAAALKHPNIDVVYEIDEVDGVDFIAMELIEGDKLGAVLERGPLPLEQALGIAIEVADGLATAHEKGIVHRDLKPGNIMLTKDGHPKIIDFGLAKLLEPKRAIHSDAETALKLETQDGAVVGTVAYMSPEQARGESVDYRSDIFSLGLVLHEMATGQHPFVRRSAPETLNAIINEPAPSVEAAIPGETAPELQRIVSKCLMKDPTERYQTMKGMAVDLKALRHNSPQRPPVDRHGFRVRWLLASAGGVLALLLLAGALFLRQSHPVALEPVPEASSRPSVAILLFDNINQDPALEWMRLGLAEMLVTDLSQSPHLDVISMDHIYQVLADIDRLDERVTSLETKRQVSKRSRAGALVLGNFIQAGETIRINLRVQHGKSGEIMMSEKVEGPGESSVFRMVDELARRIHVGIAPSTAAQVSQPIEELTTSSLEAFRFFIEGSKLYLRDNKMEEAIALVQKAVEIDADFAEAHSLLADLHWNIRHYDEGKAHAERALANVERLTAYQRYSL